MSELHKTTEAPAKEADTKLPAWSVRLKNGGKVTLVQQPGADRNVLEFEREGATTTIVLSDAALSAVVALAVTKAGVPVHVG